MSRRDKVGQVIEIGDFVVFSAKRKASSDLQYGKVLGFPTSYNKPDCLKLVSVSDNPQGEEGSLRTYNAVLKFPSSSLIVERDQVPDNVYIILNEYKKGRQ